jgi:UDP-glucose 4-epimerase
VSARTLVVGGAGFIGSRVVERLVRAGADVEVIDSLVRGRRDWIPEPVSLHEADVRDATSLEGILRHTRPDVVIHLAAMHFIPQVDDAPELARAVNLDGTRNLLSALSPRPPQLLLFASTAAVYADRAGPISESSPLGPIDLYGETKLAGEHLVARFAYDTGTTCRIARLFNVIGTRETNPHVIPELVGQLRQGGSVVRLGNLSARRDYTDVVDVAEALTRLVDAATDRQVFNVGSGKGVSVAELVQTCERILGWPIAVEVDSTRLRRKDREELVADAGLLRATTGWLPQRPLQASLTDLLNEPTSPDVVRPRREVASTDPE